MRPMLASPATAIPDGAGWVHEVKWDGMRVLADVRDGRLTLTSRTERDVTAATPSSQPLADAYDDMLLDGEVVALDGGRPSFAALAERMHVRDRRKAERLAATRPVTLMVFDLLRLYGADLTAQPLVGPARAARAARPRRPALAGAAGLRRRRASCSTRPGSRASRGSSASAGPRPTCPGGAPPTGSRRRTARRSRSWSAAGDREIDQRGRLGAVLVGCPTAPAAGATPAGSARHRRHGGGALAERAAPRSRATDSPFGDEVPRSTPTARPGSSRGVVVEARTLELTARRPAAPAGIPRACAPT